MGVFMSDNLRIWNQVKTIDQSKIKDANVGGHKCKSVNGVEMAKSLTEAIGPIGIAWRYRVLWERFDNEAPIFHPSTNEPIVCDGVTIWSQSHSALIEFSIKNEDGSWGSFEHMGHTPYRYGSGGTTYNGQVKPFKIVVDKEYGKKTITDAMKKCMSLLGVAADVYSGDVDNYEYNAQAQDELQVKAADKSLEELEKAIEEIIKFKDTAISLAEKSIEGPSMRSINQFLVKLDTRSRSANPKVSKTATKAISLIQAKIEEKRNEKLNEKGE